MVCGSGSSSVVRARSFMGMPAAGYNIVVQISESAGCPSAAGKTLTSQWYPGFDEADGKLMASPDDLRPRPATLPFLP